MTALVAQPPRRVLGADAADQRRATKSTYSAARVLPGAALHWAVRGPRALRAAIADT